MSAARQICAVLCGLVSPIMLSNAVGLGEDPPAVSQLDERKNGSNNFTFVQIPETDQSVNDFIDRVRRELIEAKTAKELPQRDTYVKELVRILDCCVPKDWMRYGIERPADRTRHWLSERTAARVIRLLGDLHAAVAVEALSERLLVYSDMNSSRIAGVPDCPTRWALFQIGSDSLPLLSKKMTSDAYFVRAAASQTAAYILGPRAEEQLQKWIDLAENEDLRARLREHNNGFRLITANAKSRNQWITPEEYRQETLERDRAYLERNLDRPSVSDRIRDERDKLMKTKGPSSP